MNEGPPFTIIVVTLLLVALALTALRNRRTLKQPIVSNKKSFFPLFITGLSLALTGAFFMFDGDILVENTTGIATIIGIVGIGLIAASNFIFLKR